MCGLSLLKLFLKFAVTLQLFSELTEKKATVGTASLFTIQEEVIKKEGYVAYFSVSDASVPFDSFAQNCMNNTQVFIICYDCCLSSCFAV